MGHWSRRRRSDSDRATATDGRRPSWGNAPRPHWWPETEPWPPRGRPGTEAWRRIGRRMARLALLAVVTVIAGPLLIGVVLALAVGGARSVAIASITWLALGAIVAMVLASALRYWRPVNAVIAVAGRLADGDYTARVDPVTSPAMRPVAESFNRMADRLERAEADRRQLMADVSHELRTPLTIVRGELEAMADGVHELDLDRIHQLLADVAIMERLLDDLQTLSSSEAGVLSIHREPVDVAELVAGVADRFGGEARHRQVELAVTVSPGIDPDRWEAEIDPVRVTEIVQNLVRNALRATPPGGRVTIGLEASADSVAIEVTDTGRGIGADDLDRVFDRFHSGPDSDGTGLGLTISRTLARAHGGDVELASAPGAGTVATVTLPVAEP